MALTPIYVAAASVYLGYHHLPHFLDAFYGAVLCAPLAVVAGAAALPAWMAVAMYFIAMVEFYAFGAMMSPPVPIGKIILGFFPDALINGVPTALLFLAGWLARTRFMK
jgi:hypothetical protein